MTKLKRVRTSESVVSYMFDQLFDGTWRTGDRIDPAEVAATLGVSMGPVREAIMRLEWEGVVRSKYHSGHFVAPFDTAVVMDHFRAYGKVRGLATEAVTEIADPDVLERIQQAYEATMAAKDVAGYEHHGTVLSNLIKQNCGSERLEVILDRFSDVVPRSFRLVRKQDLPALKPLLREEVEAIMGGNPAKARSASERCLASVGTIVARAMERRGFPRGESRGLGVAARRGARVASGESGSA